MADRLAALLRTESSVLVFEELLVAQDDIRSIGKTVDTLLMEFDQQAFEAYLSSGSKVSAAGRSRQTPKARTPRPSPVNATNFGPAKSNPEVAADRCRDFQRWWEVLLL